MMAVSNKRGSKRPSSTSNYTSTLTTIVFIAMCVLGVWMLTGNNLGPPQETATKLLNDIKDQTTTTTSKATTSTTTDQTNTEFEDNPGKLPEDAIQPDDPKKNDNAEAVGSGGTADSGVKKEKESGKNVEGKGGELSVDEIFKQRDEKSENGEEESKLMENQQVADQNHDRNQEEMMSLEEKKNREKRRKEKKIEDMKKLAAEIAEEEDKKQKAQHQQIQNPQIPEQIQNQANPQIVPEQIQNQQNPLIPELIQNQQNPLIPDQIQNQQNPLIPEQIQNKEHPQIIPEQIQNQVNPQIPEQIQTRENPQIPEEIQSQINPQIPEQVQNQENPQIPQNPVELNSNPRDLPVLQAIQTGVEQTAVEKKSRKGKRDRAREHKPAKSTNMEEAKTGIPKESTESKKSWATQAKQSATEKERREDESNGEESIYGYTWHLCNESTGADFIPCLDNEKALKKLRSTRHYEHRERHCPEEGPTCLVPVPHGYKKPIAWPRSRDKVRLRH